MGAVLQWRKFNFFDIKTNIDEGNLSEILKDTTLTCTGSGRGIIYFGDSKGWVYSLNRQLQISSFRAHEEAIKIIHASDSSNLLLTVQENVSGPSEIKIWSPERQDSQGLPLCLRVIKPDPRPGHAAKASQHTVPCPTVSAISLHPNNALLAIGFSDGSIVLYRGDVRRERGCKMRVIVTFSSGAITNLHLRHSPKMCHLFATTKNNIYCVNCTTKDKETTVELDNVGCSPGCSSLADSKHEHELLIARKDAIYTYTTDSKTSCYVFEGHKLSLTWFRGYLIVVAKEDTSSRLSNINPTVLTVYDPLNKLVTLSTVVEGFVGVVGEWGGLYVVVSGPSLLHLSEKDLQSKLELLFKKNQFDIAIKLAKLQCCDQEDVAEILKQYGDWLYEKGNTVAAMEQYIKTIPHLEPSYVIKKFLDTQHIDNLTTYLQALHKSGNANSDHTTLMLNCYTRLRDSEQLDNFIMEGEVDCDVDLGIKVCRGAGYFDHAMALASKHGLHDHYISILMEDKKDYVAALRYITTLKFEDAKENILKHGSALLNHIPDETTQLLVALCTDYKPSNQPIINEQRSLNAYLTPEDPLYGDPEEFEYMLIGHSESTITFLEKVMVVRPLSDHLNTTLLAELLHQYSLAPEGQDQNSLEEKILKMLRNGEIRFDRDHALLLCDKHKFFAGKLILWEQAGMFEELLSWHAMHGEYTNVVDVCRRHGDANQQLWSTALRLITAETSVFAPDSSLLNTVLNKIDELQLMPSLEVVELITSSPHVTLGQVRDYLLRVVTSYSSSFASEAALTENHRQETSRMKETINSITTDTIEFTGTKCNVCNNNLDLPSVHFLCRHSFHMHCFESYAENESECPLCFPENKKLRESIAMQERNASRHEILQEQLDKSSDCFSVVAEFMGRGIFTQYQSLAALHPSPNTTKTSGSTTKPSELSGGRKPSWSIQDQITTESRIRAREGKAMSDFVPEIESKIRVLERSGQGVSGPESEARLRLQEAHKQTVMDLPSEGRLRQLAAVKEPSTYITPVPEGRLRVPERKTPPASSPSSDTRGRKHLTPPPPSRRWQKTPSPPATDKAGPLSSISAALSNVSPLTKKKSAKSENPFEEDNQPGMNPFEDFATEEDDSNPFADNYVESKNPFADRDDGETQAGTASSKSVSALSKTDNHNPFEDEYDPKLNPFED